MTTGHEGACAPLSSLHPSEQIARVMRRIYAQRMTTPSGGNLSIRGDDGGLWMTPSGLDKGTIAPEEVLYIKPDGAFDGERKPSVELPFHRRIYQVRKDIHAVIHAHPAMLTAFALARKTPSPLLYDAHRICGPVTLTPYHAPGTQALGEGIAACFSDGYSAVIMENHGCVVGARDLLSALAVFETLEYAARVEICAHQIGAPVALTADQMEKEDGLCPSCFDQQPFCDEALPEKRALCEMARRAYERRLFQSAMGSASVRLPEGHFLITPKDADRAALTPSDILRIETDCDCDACDGLISLHRSIYRTHPNVNAVLVAAPEATMAFSVTDSPLDLRTIPESYAVLREIKRLPFDALRRDTQGAARAFGVSPVAFIQNRCAVVVSDSLLSAYDKLEVLEHCARAMIAARSVGPIVPMRKDQMDELRARCGE